MSPRLATIASGSVLAAAAWPSPRAPISQMDSQAGRFYLALAAMVLPAHGGDDPPRG